MGYRRHVVILAETSTEVIYSLVVRDETNVQFTYGGRVFRFTKPLTDAMLDDAVQDIVDNGDQLPTHKKEWTEQDERGITRVQPSRESRRAEEWTRIQNRKDWPAIGLRKQR